MRRVSVVIAFSAFAVFGFGCASADHSWRGEFTARLEGSTAAIEGSAGELRPNSAYLKVVAASQRLARMLEYRYELIDKLNPPDACTDLQDEGEEKVGGTAWLLHELPKNLTPILQRKLPKILEEAVANLERLEHEAETCA